MSDQSHPPTVALYLRSLAPNGSPTTQVQLIQRLERMVSEGTIEDFTVDVVGRGILHEHCCMTTEVGKRLLDRLAAVDKWAKANDASLPGISTTTVEPSPLREQSYTMTTIPQCLLVEFGDHQIEYVSPTSIDGDHQSVSDHLDEIESRATDSTRSHARSTPVPIEFTEAADEQTDWPVPTDGAHAAGPLELKERP